MEKIVTEPSGAFFRAYLKGVPEISAQGITREIAVSRLIEAHPEIFSIVISHQ